jgi:hypothetical protein
LAYTVFDVVVDDEIEFFVSEAVVISMGFVYFVNDGFGFRGNKLSVRNFRAVARLDCLAY